MLVFIAFIYKLGDILNSLVWGSTVQPTTSKSVKSAKKNK